MSLTFHPRTVYGAAATACTFAIRRVTPFASKVKGKRILADECEAEHAFVERPRAFELGRRHEGDQVRRAEHYDTSEDA
jgi:hypothetical protein